MKIAIISDIHSNDVALEAVLRDAEARGAERYIVPGDILTDGPSGREVLRRVLDLTPWVIRGNREDYLIAHREGKGPRWEGARQFEALLWAYENLSEEDLDAVAALPNELVIELDKSASIHVVHGSPFSVSELLKPDEDMAAVERAADAAKGSVLVFGHNHRPWTGMVRGRLLVNPGSAGVHFNRACAAEYALLTCEKGAFSAELRQVPYDFAELERKLEISGLAAAAPVWTELTFGGMKEGRNRCLDFLREARAEMERLGISDPAIPNGIWDRAARS